MIRRILVCGAILTALLTISPPPSSGASKEIQELQRDVAQLQDMIKALQKSQDDRLTKIDTMVQQSINSANDAGKSAAIIQNGISNALNDLQNKVSAPVVGLNKRMDDMSNDMRTLQQAVSDLASAVSKMQSLLTDINNNVKAIQAPAPPPPGPGTGSDRGGASPLATTTNTDNMPAPGEKPPISSSALMSNANSDRSTGKLDLAVREYQDYLKWYGNTDLAPMAQYYIGWIRFSQGDYQNAVKELDVVLERFSENPRTPDAMYYKGLSLLRLDRRNDAAQEFLNLAKKYPRNDLAPKACEQLKYLGRNCPIARAAAPPKGAAKRNNKK